MASTRTVSALLGATFLTGLIAGGGVDRAFVAMPAWNQVGSLAWATCSRNADLGHGLVLYPLEAIGSAGLAFAAAVSSAFDDARQGIKPLVLAAVMASAALLVTTQAAPIMLGVGHLDDPAAVQRAFEGFRYWGDIRGVCHVIAFVAELYAIAVMMSPHPRLSINAPTLPKRLA